MCNYMYNYMCIYTYIHAYIHTHTHTHIHTTAKADLGRTPLHVALRPPERVLPGRSVLPNQYEDMTLTASVLLRNGADPNARDEEGRTPLMYAAVNGWLRVCEELVSNGAQINSVDVYGYAALHLSAQEGRAMACAWLLRKDADPAWVNVFERTPAGCALINWHECVIDELRRFRDEDAEEQTRPAEKKPGGGVLAGNVKKSRRDGKAWSGPRMRVVR
jgi:hypothetical protein